MVMTHAPDTVSDSKAVTLTVGRQQDKEEDTVAAVPVGQIPAAQQLHANIPGHSAKVRGLKVREVTREKEKEYQMV